MFLGGARSLTLTMLSRYLIYGLTDPQSGMVRYVGRSSSRMERPKSHSLPSHIEEDSHCARWLRKLRDEGLACGVVVLEELPSAAELSHREVWWIAFARGWGLMLTNLTDGGEGNSGWVPSEQTRMRRSTALKGITRTPEWRAKIASALRGKPLSPERRAAMRGRGGWHHTSEARDKIAEAASKQVWSDARRKAVSQRQSGHIHSQESRAKTRDSIRCLTGQIHTPEAHAKSWVTRRIHQVCVAWGCAL